MDYSLIIHRAKISSETFMVKMNDEGENTRPVLFINGRVPPPFVQGGAEVSMHTLMSMLVDRGMKVHLVSIVGHYLRYCDHGYPENMDEIMEGLGTRGIEYSCDKKVGKISYKLKYEVEIYKEKEPGDVIESFKDRYGKYPVVLTQLDYAAEIIKFALKRKVPTVFFLRDTMTRNLKVVKLINKKNHYIKVVFNSESTHRHYKKLDNLVETEVVYPPIILNKYKLSLRDPKYITLINPVWYKGGRIFEKLIPLFPKWKFLGVTCWYDPKKDGIDLLKFRNAELWEKKDDVRDVYKMTKLLLIPSQWKEAFGRVGAEALVAGLPVVASDQEGLRESLGDHAVFVKKYKSVESWVKAVKEVMARIDSADYHEQEGGLEYARKFSAELMGDKLFKLVRQLSA
ncbi:glycosyltransferase family 4 protein [Patescibacteria group bacterium]|nr:glycosyltransferase family 4 protein [Patescibacteria group bacterium]